MGKGKFIGKDADWLEDLLATATQKMHVLNDKSQRFIISMRERFNLYASHTMVSPRQMEWLRHIEQRLAEFDAEAELRREDCGDEDDGVVPVDEYMRERR